jgi:predicted membrane protein
MLNERIKKYFKRLADNKLEIILVLIIAVLMLMWKLGLDFVVLGTLAFSILLYGWKKRIIAQGFKKAKADLFKRVKEDLIKKKLSTALLLIILVLLLILKFNIEPIVFLMIFFVFWLYSWENRILLGLGMFFLIICYVLLSSQKPVLAEQLGIYGYYFLIMTVLLQIFEYKNKTNSPVKSEATDY